VADSDPIVPRSADQVTGLLDGFEMVPPGLKVVSEWQAENEPTPRPAPAEVANYGAVVRKS
jgi:hypothetical protein